MILSKDIKIKAIKDITGEYIESELKRHNYDVLRWAITDFDGENYIINFSYAEK